MTLEIGLQKLSSPSSVTQTISSLRPRKMMKAERHVVKADRGRLLNSWDNKKVGPLQIPSLAS